MIEICPTQPATPPMSDQGHKAEEAGSARGLGGRLHTDLATLEEDDAVCQGEKRIIPASPNVRARQKGRATLSDKDRARNHLLAAESLDAAKLRIGITPVSS